ncbi:MAG: hypothetical protein KGM43_06345 [Planctomycetota bacterium]|nr:hypothetical protein [Planctomycetota bacterium]
MLNFIFQRSGTSTRERVSELAKRCGDLSPIADPVRRVLFDGNRASRLAGVDFAGRKLAPLAPSTLRKPRSNPTPLIPRGESSRMIAGYVVHVDAGPGRLRFLGSWPSLGVLINYFATGTRFMPRRDPLGFREVDLAEIRTLMRDYVAKGKR